MGNSLLRSDSPPLAFSNAAEFRRWLGRHENRHEGLWLRIFRKASGHKTITYAEALEEALCHGWIDGQRRAYDRLSFLQRFTPRRPRSNWSKINTGHAKRLIRKGRMKSSGLREIEAAKADGRWRAAYDSPARARIPQDFLKALAPSKTARAFFETLDKKNLYAIAYRLQTSKTPEIRSRRMEAILEKLGRGEKFHS